MGALSFFLSKAAKRAPPQPATQAVSFSAPQGSINTISAGGDMPAGDCILRFNMIPGEYGNRVRLGSKEWVTGLTGGSVRCLVPFTAQVSANNKVFATTSTGIWDVTTSSATPTQVLAFGTTDAYSGYGTWAAFATSTGHFLFYADETNGCYLYTESTGTWAAASFTGISASNVRHVCVWKNRVWLTEANTGKAYYLATNAVSGAATAQNFGARFSTGGYLVGLWSLTYDGGSGMDDSLVAISSGGDVLVYQGSDPATVGLFLLKGVFQIGALPAGRRVASELGGDLLVMTRSGIVSLREVTLGASTQYAVAKIQNLWNKWMLTRADLRGWHMVQNPEDSTLIVVAPNGESVDSDQLVMSLHTKGWSQYRDLDMGNAAATYGGKVWYGTVDGKIRIMDGYTDGRTIADPTTTTPIKFSLLTSFTNLGTPRQKRISWARPTWISDTAEPTYEIQARFDHDFTEADEPTASAAGGPNTWDTGTWDNAVWGGDYSPTTETRGLAGAGVNCALAIRGTSVTRTVLTNFDVGFDVGGFF